MRKGFLITTAAAALLAGTMFAAGQGTQAPSPGGMERGSPGQGPMQRGQEQTQGQGSREQGQTQSPGQRDERKGKAQTQGRDQKKEQTQGQGQREQGPGQREQGQAPREDRPQQGQREQRERGEQGQRQGAQQRERSGGVTLTTEQRTKIRQTVIRRSGAPRVTNVNFSINVGTVVPRRVRAVAVPPTLVEIHPAWSGYLYFIVGGRLVVIEPDSYRIVAVLVV